MQARGQRVEAQRRAHGFQEADPGDQAHGDVLLLGHSQDTPHGVLAGQRVPWHSVDHALRPLSQLDDGLGDAGVHLLQGGLLLVQVIK